MRIINMSQTEIMADAVQRRLPFTNGAGTFSGMPGSGGPGIMRNCPKSYRLSLETARYVFVSYETPIVWLDIERSIVNPPVRYSVTTSRHVSKAYEILELDKEFSIDDDGDDFPVVCDNGCPEGYLGKHKFSCREAGPNIVGEILDLLQPASLI